jgi:hypothetical protein
MPRAIGDKNKGSNEFGRLYEQMCVEEGVNPVRVLVKLCKSRTQSIRLQAAGHLMKYRFPQQASVAMEVEQVAQMVMTWETPIPALPDGSEPDDRREFPRHEIDDAEFEEIPL